MSKSEKHSRWLLASRSKEKGNRFEREIVNIINDAGHGAIRAYASNGLSLGEGEECDIKATINDDVYRIQAKVRKNIANWIIPNTEEVDIQVIKQDRGEPLVVQPLSTWLEDKNVHS